MRYAVARLNLQIREVACRNYVTDGLYALVNGGLTMTMHYSELIKTMHYSELIEPVKKKTEETEELSQDEIVDKIWAKIGG